MPSKPKSQHSSISNRLSSSSSSKSLTDIIPEEHELASENENEETEEVEVEVDDSNAEGDNESNEEGLSKIIPPIEWWK